jgi:hypothetical protein
MSDLADLLKQLSADISPALEHAVRSMRDLRDEVGIGELDDPVSLHEQLKKNRKAMDRAETFVAELGRLHSKAVIAEEDHKGYLEDAEATALQKAGPAEDYSSGRERNARLAVMVMDEKIALRKVARQRAEIQEALEYARTLFRGMDASRRDVETRLRMITLETGLEK